MFIYICIVDVFVQLSRILILHTYQSKQELKMIGCYFYIIATLHLFNSVSDTTTIFSWSSVPYIFLFQVIESSCDVCNVMGTAQFGTGLHGLYKTTAATNKISEYNISIKSFSIIVCRISNFIKVNEKWTLLGFILASINPMFSLFLVSCFSLTPPNSTLTSFSPERTSSKESRTVPSLISSNRFSTFIGGFLCIKENLTESTSSSWNVLSKF